MRKHVIEKDVVSVVADFDFQALLSKAMFLHHRDVPITITILQIVCNGRYVDTNHIFGY